MEVINNMYCTHRLCDLSAGTENAAAGSITLLLPGISKVNPGRDCRKTLQDPGPIVVDSYTKWLEEFHMSQIPSQATITRLRKMFTACCLLEQIVTNNCDPVTSEEFWTLHKKN